MLGELINEEQGKVVVRRILPTGSVEVTFESEGTLVGVNIRNMGTYTSDIRSDGTLYGEGQGIIRGENGEIVTWKGQGVGEIKASGEVSYVGSLFYQTQAEGLLGLNKLVGVFEYEVDAEGNTSTKTHEWK